MIVQNFWILFLVFTATSFAGAKHATKVHPEHKHTCSLKKTLDPKHYKYLIDSEKMITEKYLNQVEHDSVEEEERNIPVKEAQKKLSRELAGFKRGSDSTAILKLEDLCYGYPIFFKAALMDIDKRAKILKSAKHDLLDSGYLSFSRYNELIPSADAIIVIRYRNKYFINEGNGRVKALKKVFHKNFKIEVLVREYEPTDQGRLNILFDQFYSSLDFDKNCKIEKTQN